MEKNKSLVRGDATITLKCNNNCIFCPRKILSSISLDEDSNNLIKSLKKIREKSDSITLTGGEVTIMHNFFKILDACNSLRFKKIALITNGRMFSNDQFTRKVLQSSVSDIGVSIYSIDEGKHDFMTNVKGSCSQTKEGIFNLIESSIHLRVNITISKFNCDYVFSTIKELYLMGVKEFLLISVITKDKNIIYNNQSLKKQFDRIIEEDLPDATIIFRGFPAVILPNMGNVDGKNKELKIEGHRFDTFVAINKESGEYLLKTDSLLTKLGENVK